MMRTILSRRELLQHAFFGITAFSGTVLPIFIKPSQAQADEALRTVIGGTVYFNDVSVVNSSISYSFIYTTNIACPTLFARVTLSNGPYYATQEYVGTGTSIRNGGTFANVPSGSYSLRVVVYPTAPIGYESDICQASRIFFV